jgi:hypothetical protein
MGEERIDGKKKLTYIAGAPESPIKTPSGGTPHP